MSEADRHTDGANSCTHAQLKKEKGQTKKANSTLRQQTHRRREKRPCQSTEIGGSRLRCPSVRPKPTVNHACQCRAKLGWRQKRRRSLASFSRTLVRVKSELRGPHRFDRQTKNVTTHRRKNNPKCVCVCARKCACCFFIFSHPFLSSCRVNAWVCSRSIHSEPRRTMSFFVTALK